MKTLTISMLGVASLGCALVTAGQERHPLADIRQIDFRNFRYPWQTPHGASNFRWLTRFDTNISLRDGVKVFKAEECGSRCPEVAISEVLYEDVNRDAIVDAVVVLNYSSGGTAHWDYVYLYTVESNTAKLIAAFETGTRAYQGLHRVYVGNGHLIVELNEPDESQSECCATWRTRTEYEWRDGHFQALGEPVKERIPVHDRSWYLAQ